jgi:UDP-N-acetylmuramoyl-L-alanyl-D-glutamate--2,6-diaminopimelate ligase
MMKRRLSDLISACNIEIYKIAETLDIFCINISSLTMDSRTYVEGGIFIATPSLRIEENIRDALKRGCKIFLLEQRFNSFLNNYSDITILNTDNCYAASSKLASCLYKEKPKNIVYITGTNGKSSTVSLLRQIWTMNGKSAASYGTLGLERNGEKDQSLDLGSLTSVDPISFHKMLTYLVKQEVTHFACEASSHGLQQFRLDNVPISAAGFLNLTQDHLDYHRTMDDYFIAKSLLFSRVLKEKGYAILNKDSYGFEKLISIAKARDQKILTYSQKDKADFYVEKRIINNTTITLDLNFFNQTYKNIDFLLFGDFHVENLLCAAACAYATGVLPDDIIKSIPRLKSIEGRMQYIGSKNGADIFVDFAHTPDALAKILDAVRAYNPKKIHLVFGCGGDRDPKKRPIMGKIAAEKADHIYITDDNPRFEDAAAIRKEIHVTAPEALNIEGRQIAIQLAINNLQTGEILIVAGKGHEQGQIINGEIYPFCDKQEIMKYL